MVSVPNCSSPGLVQHAFHDQKVGSEAQFSECRHGLDLRAVALPLLQKPEAFKKKVLPQFDSKKSLGSVFNASSAGSNSFCSWRVVSQSFAGNFHTSVTSVLVEGLVDLLEIDVAKALETEAKTGRII